MGPQQRECTWCPEKRRLSGPEQEVLIEERNRHPGAPGWSVH